MLKVHSESMTDSSAKRNNKRQRAITHVHGRKAHVGELKFFQEGRGSDHLYSSVLGVG